MLSGTRALGVPQFTVLPFPISRQVQLPLFCLQCFDAVGWAAGRASGL